MRSTIVRKGAVAVAVLSLGTLLASCGGGGGGGTSISGTSTSGTPGTSTSGTPGTSTSGTPGTSTSGTPGTSTSGTYLAYVGGSPSDPGLYLVDPSNPTSPIGVITTSTVYDCEPLDILGGYNTSNSSYTNLYTQEVDCLQLSNTSDPSRLSGPLIKVSLIKSNTTPSAIQISSLTNVTQFGGYWNDEINGIKYMEVYTYSNQSYLVNSKMTPTDYPIPLNGKQIKYPIYDLTGSITGFLVQNSNTLEECDTSLSTCGLLANSVTSLTKIATNPSNENMFLCVNGNNVDKLSGSSLTSMGLPCGSMSSFTNDNQNIYAVDNNGNVLELSFSNPSTTWQTMYVNSGGLDQVYILGMTQKYLIIDGHNPINNTINLIAISRTGGPSITFYTYGFPNGEGGKEFSLSNQFLFTISNSSNSSISACVWTEGSSSASCSPNSYWAGESIATSGTFDFYSHFTPYKILEVESTTGFVGGTLYSIDPTNLSSQTFLGNIPSNYDALNGFYGIGNTMLLYGFNLQQSTSNGVYTDVFFANLSSNTLIQIPNAIGRPLYLFPNQPF